MRRNTLHHAIKLRNPEDPEEVVRAAPGDTYDDGPAWVKDAADATGGQAKVDKPKPKAAG